MNLKAAVLVLLASLVAGSAGAHEDDHKTRLEVTLEPGDSVTVRVWGRERIAVGFEFDVVQASQITKETCPPDPEFHPDLLRCGEINQLTTGGNPVGMRFLGGAEPGLAEYEHIDGLIRFRLRSHATEPLDFTLVYFDM